ncbi:hypothetical protein R1sor_014167 [Riccia sorocarpa]|uniref:Uncharacterized protein n=1 Tax=Riccia sorocarpa TaxID=122646 RepID=A0ABD3H8L7_9MARC
MGKCMSKDQMLQDKLIQHISSPVRTDNGVGFALGRLSSSHQTRWVKYEDMVPSEEVKPVVSEGQPTMTRSGSRSYGLTYPHGHLVSCVAFVSSGPHGDSECSCGQRRPSESTQTASSPAQEKLTTEVAKTPAKPTTESNTYRDAPKHDVENAVVRPAKPLFHTTNKNRPALRETSVNIIVPAEVPSSKPGKVTNGTYGSVDSENKVPRRAPARGTPRSSVTEKSQALSSPPGRKPPVRPQRSETADCSDEVLKSPVLVEKICSPKNVTSPTLGSSLQSILSAICDSDSSSLVEEVISKASAAHSRCKDLEKAYPAESKASHTPLSDESDTESSLGEIDPDTPSSKTVSRQSFDQSEDDAPGHTPVTARSVRTRLPIDSECRNEEKPLHWRASALYTNCLFEESPAKNAVKSAERRFSGGGTKFTIGHDAAIGHERGSETSYPVTAASGPTQELLQPDSADIGLELKLERVNETLSSGASTSTFDREPSSSAILEMTTPAKDDTLNSESEKSSEVKAFLQSTKKVVLSLSPDGTADCESTVKQQPSVTDSLTSSSFREIFSSSSLAAVLELEALLVTSDVRRVSGHGVEGLQIVGSELTELFSSNARPSPPGSNKEEAGHSSRFEVKIGDLNVYPETTIPRSEHPLAVSSPRSLISSVELAEVVPYGQQESTGNGAASVSSENCELQSLELETAASGKHKPQLVSLAQAPQDAGDNQREERNSTLSYRCSNSPLPLRFPITTPGMRIPTPVSTTPEPFTDHSLHTALSLEDFQFLLDAAEGDEEKKADKGGSAGARTGNTLASFGRSILQKLRDSLPTTPISSIPSTPRMSASSTPLLEGILKGSTPQRTGPHANSVALSPEEIAEIWGAFEQIHLT